MYRHFLEDDSAKLDSSVQDVRMSQEHDTRGYFPKEYLEHAESDENRLSLQPETNASLLLNKYQKSLRIHT